MYGSPENSCVHGVVDIVNGEIGCGLYNPENGRSETAGGADRRYNPSNNPRCMGAENACGVRHCTSYRPLYISLERSGTLRVNA